MAKTHPEVRLNRRPFSGIFEVVRVAADGKTITDRWPLSAEDQAWLARRSPAPQQVTDEMVARAEREYQWSGNIRKVLTAALGGGETNG